MADDIYVLGSSSYYALGIPESYNNNFTKLNLTITAMDTIVTSGVSFVVYTSGDISPDQPVFIDDPPVYDPINEPEPDREPLNNAIIFGSCLGVVVVVEVIVISVVCGCMKKKVKKALAARDTEQQQQQKQQK